MPEANGMALHNTRQIAQKGLKRGKTQQLVWGFATFKPKCGQCGDDSHQIGTGD